MEVKVNTAGNSDGAYRFWADDTLIVERENVDLRGNTGDKINEFMLDCYWNGGSPAEQNRYYDNLVIATEKIGLYSGINSITPPISPKGLHHTPEIMVQTAGPQKIVFFLDSPVQSTFLSLFTLSGKKITTLSFIQTDNNRAMAIFDTPPFTFAQGIYIAVLESNKHKTPYTILVTGNTVSLNR